MKTKKLPKLPYWFPMCAKCGKWVDTVLWTEEVIGDRISISILCHGEKEERFFSHIRKMTVTEMGRWPDAFVTKPADMVKAKEGWVV